MPPTGKRFTPKVMTPIYFSGNYNSNKLFEIELFLHFTECK